MQTAEILINDIINGAYDDTFSKLYCTSSAEEIAKQRARYIGVIEDFTKIYGSERALRLYSAPGRTEIGGNHTDHNNGIVVAAAVNLDIIAVVAQSESNIVRVTSRGFNKQDVIDLNVLTPIASEEGRSASLIRGVASDIAVRGGKLGGFDAYTASDVLRGSGLSSSAAFEVIIAQIFNAEFNAEAFSAIELAQISQIAENKFFNKPSGLMDQMACSVGGAIKIDFETEGKPIVDKVNFDLSAHNFALCITDTKGSHSNLTDEYAAIRTEMESVAAFFGKKVLREVGQNELYTNIAEIRKHCSDRAVLRALHYFAECKRAEEICTALKHDDIEDFLALVISGGHSSFEYNQNVYSIKAPEQQGVALALALSQHVLYGKGAWRLQGGGFAGTIQAFVPQELLNEYCAELDGVFGAQSCHILSIRNFGAVCVKPLI